MVLYDFSTGLSSLVRATQNPKFLRLIGILFIASIVGDMVVSYPYLWNL